MRAFSELTFQVAMRTRATLPAHPPRDVHTCSPLSFASLTGRSGPASLLGGIPASRTFGSALPALVRVAHGPLGPRLTARRDTRLADVRLGAPRSRSRRSRAARAPPHCSAGYPPRGRSARRSRLSFASLTGRSGPASLLGGVPASRPLGSALPALVRVAHGPLGPRLTARRGTRLAAPRLGAPRSP